MSEALIVNGCAVSPAVWSGWVGGSREVWPCECESPTKVGECVECRGFPPVHEVCWIDDTSCPECSAEVSDG